MLADSSASSEFATVRIASGKNEKLFSRKCWHNTLGKVNEKLFSRKFLAQYVGESVRG